MVTTYNAEGCNGYRKRHPSRVRKATDMFLFRRPDYQSDTTLFLQQLQQQDATLQARQQAGMVVHGGSHASPTAEQSALRQGFAEAAIAQQPYVYATVPEID